MPGTLLFEKDTPMFCTGKQPYIYIKNGVIDYTPMFCTGKQPYIYIKNGVIDQREMDMFCKVKDLSCECTDTAECSKGNPKVL